MVFRHPVPAKVKVYLLFLADHMKADRKVSVPRRTVAGALGCSERRVNDWNTTAVRAGLLDVVVRGQKHVTAVYQGLFPDSLSGTKSSPLRTTENQPPENGFSGTPGGPTTTTADLSVRGYDRNGSSYEKRSAEVGRDRAAVDFGPDRQEWTA